MRRVVRRALMLLASLVLLPAAAYAQAAITGVVRDTSGAVLPGVTVEAASPALIERVRSGVTDGTGRYRIEQLRPGSYAITFTLPGFATVRQEDVQLMGTFVATVNAELRVGALEETVTVTGDTSVVDVQSAVTQRVMTDEIMNALPSGKVPGRLASLLPSVNQAVQDVGGLQGDGFGRGDLTTHGVGDARQVVNGLSNMSMSGSRGAHGAYNMAAFAEMAVDTAGIGAEQKEGGVRLNLIPQDGGNSLKTYFFFSFANSSMQGDNFTQELKDRGLGTPDSLKRYLDVNPAVGGPILRDKLWFHTTARLNHAFSYLPLFFNKNAGNPNAWTYEPDTSRPASNEYSIANTNTRVTWQVTPTHKIGVTYDLSRNCDCPRGLTASRSPEANSGGYVTVWPKHQPSADWTAPLTSRLLLEAGAYSMTSYYHRPLVNPYFAPTPVRMIQVMEQSTGMAYRATAPFTEPTDQNRSARAVMSYITGAHAFKFGVQYATGYQPRHSFTPDANISYRFNNGVPNRLTLFAPDWYDQIDMKADHGVFVQDRWTVNRLTMTGGLRLDHFHIGFPEITVGPTLYAPTRNIVFPASDGANWSNISPRFGAAYDLFGDGKTALKISIGRYLAGQIGSTSISSGTFTTEMSPTSLLVTSTNRSWNDANRNFAPDCDLLNPVANGECGAMDNSAFGSTRIGTQYDPGILTGWQKGEYNWQFSAGVQREVLPRVSVDLGYFRTVFRNLFVNDNRAVSPADYDQFSITAPVDPRLPNGGGYVVGPLFDLKPTSFSRPADNFITFADNYGKRIEMWNGFDVNFTARPAANVLLQGGTSTGRRTSDNCEILAKLPEMNPFGMPFCHQQEKFLTQFKLLGSYTIPRADVLVSATVQSLPLPVSTGLFVSGNQAIYTATNAVVAPSLGRSLSGGASNVAVNIVEPGTLYSGRMNQIDVRIGKIINVGRSKTTVGVDIYNLLNSSAVLAVNTAYANWLQPQSILAARFAKVNLQFNF